MATKSAKDLKEKFSECSVDMYEPLTFGELKIGEKFIGFPLPGDNHGHGGFRGTHSIFIKTKETRATCGYYGKARHCKDRVASWMPEKMLVVRVE